jgi:putative hydroxymethylpyrimidine transport system substrate-binding protein
LGPPSRPPTPRARSGRPWRSPLYLLNLPDESFSLFIEGRRELHDELNRRAWTDTLPRVALRPAALDTARYQRFAAFLEQQGLIKAPPPVADYAVEIRR